MIQSFYLAVREDPIKDFFYVQVTVVNGQLAAVMGCTKEEATSNSVDLADILGEVQNRFTEVDWPVFSHIGVRLGR